MLSPFSSTSEGLNNAQAKLKFRPPRDIDLKKLAELTESSLKVLQPWYNAEHQSDALKKITNQAHKYTQAIHSSIAAAQHGFNVAKDALTLSNLVSSGEKTQEELREFAYSMLLLGQDAYSDAQNCPNEFRDVRRVMTQLILSARESSQEHQMEHVEGQLRPLEEGIPVFEGLVVNISAYVEWWHWLELKANYQVESVKQLQVHYASLRQKAVAKKWAELQEKFAQYTEEIQKLEEAYQDMFQPSVLPEDIPASPRPRRSLTREYTQYHFENLRTKGISKFRRFLGLVSCKGCMPGSRAYNSF